MKKGTVASQDNPASRLPRHIAIIMDGNGRWAKQRKLPRHAGHSAGASAVRKVTEHCVKSGIEVLTLFAFSSENWKRPRQEVSLIMDLFIRSLQTELKRLQKNGVRLRVIGDRSTFSEQLQHSIRQAEQLTESNTKMVLQIAANYGGKWDMLQAAKKLARDAQQGSLDPELIDEEMLSQHLSFAGLPDPDLLIRTGGEQRLSNFILWQAAYAELYFTDLFWPDFDADALNQALQDFAGRQRRFGQIRDETEQLDSESA